MDLIKNKVSIITPVYNSEKLISESIESVQAQTHKDWELLIVMDSGTSDRTADIVLSYSAKDPRVQLIRVPQGRGVSISRNYAIERAQGEFICFLDSDDLWLPEKLEKQLRFMRKEHAVISCTSFRRISEDGQRVGRVIQPPKIQTYSDLLIENKIPCLTVMVHQERTGKLQMVEYKHEDFILWLQLLKKGFVCLGLQEDLARYRIMENSRSTETKSLQTRWNIYRHFEKLDLVSTLYYMVCYVIFAAKKRVLF